jgi:hypothetical protein
MTPTLNRNRRRLLKSAGAGFLAAIGIERAEAAEAGKAEFKALNENDRVDIGDRAEQIIEKAYNLGWELEKKHGGCARCTVAALQKAIEFVPEDKGLFRAASCLDGGATPKGIQNCGCFTGSGMVIGWTCGSDTFGGTRLSHKLIRKVYERFEAEYGSVLCRDVREKAQRDCPQVVANAAKWTAEALLGQFCNYQAKQDTR